jgi:hypothetical protein
LARTEPVVVFIPIPRRGRNDHKRGEAFKSISKELDLSEKIALRLGAKVGKRAVHAVDAIDFGIEKGEVVGLVGDRAAGNPPWEEWWRDSYPLAQDRYCFVESILL